MINEIHWDCLSAAASKFNTNMKHSWSV